MKNFIYIVFFLSVLNYSAESTHKYGSLAWDHDKYIERIHPVQDAAMSYIKDFHQRIKAALDDGNVLRADYLSNLLLELLTTGGSYGFRQGGNSGPTSEELHTINKSVALSARSLQVKAKEFPYDWSDPTPDVKDLEYKIYDHFKNLDARTNQIKNSRIIQHRELLKDLFMAHLQTAGINIPNTIQSPDHPRRIDYAKKHRTKPNLSGPASYLTVDPTRTQSLMDQQDKDYTTDLFKKHVALMSFYMPSYDSKGELRKASLDFRVSDDPPSQFYLEPMVENQNTIVYDFIRDEKFLLTPTPADDHCWLRAVSCNDHYSASRFLEDLLKLDGEKRKEAARFMAMTNGFLSTLKGGHFLSTYPELSKFLGLANLGENAEFIDFLSQKDVFAALVTHDLTKKGEDLWQVHPTNNATRPYGGLYALLHKKNVVTFEWAAYETHTIPRLYIYLTTDHFFLNETYEYVYYFAGRIHHGSLLPLPLKSTVRGADELFFKTWYSETKNSSHGKPPSSNP